MCSFPVGRASFSVTLGELCIVFGWCMTSCSCTRSVQKVHNLTHKTTEYVNKNLPPFKIVSCNWYALGQVGSAFHQSADFFVREQLSAVSASHFLCIWYPHHLQVCILLSIVSVSETTRNRLVPNICFVSLKMLLVSVLLITNTLLQLALHIFHDEVTCLQWKWEASTQRAKQK